MAPKSPDTHPRESWHRLARNVLVLLLGAPLLASAQATEVVKSPPQPPITIVLKGGAGTIKVDRTWTKGTNLCWESRGHRKCTPWRMVSYIRYPQ